MAKQHGTGERHWYAIHTYSGYENAVTRNLRQRIDSLNMNDKIFDVVVPTACSAARQLTGVFVVQAAIDVVVAVAGVWQLPAVAVVGFWQLPVVAAAI